MSQQAFSNPSAPSMATALQVKFTLLQGDDDQASRELVLHDGQSNVLVRRSSDDESKNLPSTTQNLNISNGAISREHAEIFTKSKLKSDTTFTNTIDDLALYIVDSSSRHGTFVNSLKLAPGAETELKEGDKVTFGIDIVRPKEAEFRAPTYQVTFETVKDESIGRRGASYSVPDDIDSLVESDSDDSYSDTDSVLDAADPYGQDESDIIDLTQNDVENKEFEDDQYGEDDSDIFDYYRDEVIEEAVLSECPSPAIQGEPISTPELVEDINVEELSSSIRTVHEQHATLFTGVEQPSSDTRVAESVHSSSDLEEYSPIRPSRKRNFEAAMIDEDFTQVPAQMTLSVASSQDASTITDADKVLDLHVASTTVRHELTGEPRPISIISEQRPIKRSRLSMTALSVGMFLAGSTTTFAALAYLPDIA